MNLKILFCPFGQQKKSKTQNKAWIKAFNLQSNTVVWFYRTDDNNDDHEDDVVALTTTLGQVFLCLDCSNTCLSLSHRSTFRRHDLILNRVRILCPTITEPPKQNRILPHSGKVGSYHLRKHHPLRNIIVVAESVFLLFFYIFVTVFLSR